MKVVACVASVTVRFRSKERPRKGIFGFDRARNETRARKWKKEKRKGKEGDACRQTPRFLKTCVRQRTQRLIGSASRTVLTCVDQRFVSYWEVTYSTWHAHKCPVVVVYSGRQDLPSDARAFSLTSFETQSSSCNYIRTSDRLIYSPKCLLDLNN